jgi:hypothetical protein
MKSIFMLAETQDESTAKPDAVPAAREARKGPRLNWRRMLALAFTITVWAIVIVAVHWLWTRHH